MKQILIVILLCGASWSQVPAPDIAGQAGDAADAAQRAYREVEETRQIRQRTALLKQQTENLKKQNTLSGATQVTVSTTAVQFITPIRKPRIDDIDAATGKPRFASYADFEDAKDEWLIEEAMRRFEALHTSPN
jgi:Sec-independent protein translocase protein TatA